MTVDATDDALLRMVACTLVSAPADVDALTSAERLIADGHGKALLSMLMDERKLKQASGSNDKPVSSSLMAVLEQIVEGNARVGTSLMARLYPLAAKLQDHTVYNAIELWMDHISGAGVPEVLSMLIREGVRPSVRVRYQERMRAIQLRTLQR